MYICVIHICLSVNVDVNFMMYSNLCEKTNPIQALENQPIDIYLRSPAKSTFQQSVHHRLWRDHNLVHKMFLDILIRNQLWNGNFVSVLCGI